MGDFASWRLGKRYRRDFEDVPSRAGYGSSRLDVGRGYDDRSVGVGLTDYSPLAYDGGFNPASGLGLSLSGRAGVGNFGGGGIGAIDDPGLNARLAAYGAGLDGRTTASGLNGGALKRDNVRGATDIRFSDASSTLFVDGLPSDCSRREAAHVFRPFIGFKEVRVVNKERVGGEKVVLCFVDFADPKCAATALEALQGYKFDEKDPDSHTLNLTFARAPGVRAGGSRGRDRSPFRGRDRRR